MAPRSKIAQLPPEMRSFIEGWLVEHAFGNYDGLVEAFNTSFEARLSELGLTISRAAMHRFGQDFEERVAALKKSTQMAQAIATELGDDEGSLNDALIRMAQTKAFNLLLDLELNPEDVDFTKLVRSIADLSRSHVQLQKYRAEVKQRAEAAAESIAKTVTSQGLSQAAAEEIRKKILGIAT